MRICRILLCLTWVFVGGAYFANILGYDVGWDDMSFCVVMNNGTLDVSTGWWMEQRSMGTGAGFFVERVGPLDDWFPSFWFHEFGFTIPAWVILVTTLPSWILLRRKYTTAMRSAIQLDFEEHV